MLYMLYMLLLYAYLSHLQKPNRIQRLLDIRHLVLEPHHSSLEVLLHELVLGDQLLEAPQGGLDVGARCDIVLDLVDEGRLGDSSGVRGRGGIIAIVGWARQRAREVSFLSF